MWIYEKKLEYPAKVSRKDVKLAKYIITQYGGPDGEVSAGLRYLTQRYSMPTSMAKAVCNDIGTEELAHMEIMATLVYKLMQGATVEELKAVDLGGHYADHNKALFYVDATGNPWTAAYIQSKGDAIADLHDDMAAEEKARATYEWLINLSHDDPELTDTLRFLREREVVHFQRFGETLDNVYEEARRKRIF